jgi:hypothetical protein
MKDYLRSVAVFTFAVSLVGCGSAPKSEPESPTSPPAASATSQTKPEADAAPAASAATDSTPAEAPASASDQPEASSAGDGLRKASRPPVELITNPTALYVFNFAESEVGKTAKEQCDAAGGGHDKVAACLQKARSKVPVESIRFKKKDKEFYWITLNRYKGNLLKWHIIQFMPGEESSDKVTLKLTGKDKGIAPMARIPSTLQIELPNDYSIIVVDPEFGRMTFDAKIGAVED